MTPLHVAPMDPPETCMRVLTNSMGWVKLTAKAAAAPPQAMDSRRLGLRSSVIVVELFVRWMVQIGGMIGLQHGDEMGYICEDKD